MTVFYQTLTLVSFVLLVVAVARAWWWVMTDDHPPDYDEQTLAEFEARQQAMDRARRRR